MPTTKDKEEPKALLLGISGPSSSGKTTLARLLRDIFPKTLILHLDDFYLHDSQIPLKDGIQDWDCLESLNLADFRAALSYIKAYGTLPPTLTSKEDQNAVGEHGVDPNFISQCKERIGALTADVGWNTPIAIIDGFLLFPDSMADIRSLFDVRLFLRTSYATAKRRREARSGYVTLEGFWEDPPGYVDRIVWPNYVRDHAFLFENGDVHGPLDSAVCDRIGVDGMPQDAQGSMTQCLKWALGILNRAVEGHAGAGKQ